MQSDPVKRLRVGLLGASGRMGHEVAAILAGDSSYEVVVPDDELTSKVDVWIDFSSPEGLAKLLPVARASKTPIVSGTTGLSDSHRQALLAAARDIPVLWASNMSLGVALLNEAIRLFSQLKGFDFQIEEIHHNRKKDRPSGTALTLQKTLRTAVGKDVPEPLSMRGGGVFGVHKVWAFSDEEVLSFEHQALNRAVFARGAVKAALWLVTRSPGPGLHTIQDVLSNPVGD